MPQVSSQASTAEQEWYYLDDDKNTQGPFTNTLLQQWFEQGYIERSLMVQPVEKGAQPTAEKYVPLHTHFDVQEQVEQSNAATAEADVTTQTNSDNSATAEATQPSTHTPAIEDEFAVDGYDSDDMIIPEDVAETLEAGSNKKSPASADSNEAATTTNTSIDTNSTAVEWYYLDDNGEAQGPFPTETMRAWYGAEYFNTETKVRSSLETEFTALGVRTATNTAFLSTSTNSINTTAPSNSTDIANVSANTIETDKWYYSDNDGLERGPYTLLQMRYWYQKGWFQYNDTAVRSSSETTGATLKQRTTPPAFTVGPSIIHLVKTRASINARNNSTTPAAAASAAAATAATQTTTAPTTITSTGATTTATAQAPATSLEERWYYLDSEAKEQGPFTTAEMRAWYTAGYLPNTIRVRQVGEDEKTFTAIADRHCSFTQPAPAAAVAPVAAQYGYNSAAYHQPYAYRAALTFPTAAAHNTGNTGYFPAASTSSHMPAPAAALHYDPYSAQQSYSRVAAVGGGAVRYGALSYNAPQPLNKLYNHDAWQQQRNQQRAKQRRT